MAEQKKGSTGRKEGAKRESKDFKTYVHKETGTQLHIQKSGGIFSFRAGVTHSKTGEFTTSGRIIPDYEGDLETFKDLHAFVEGINTLYKDAVADLSVQAKKERIAFNERKRRREERQNSPRRKKPKMTNGSSTHTD